MVALFVILFFAVLILADFIVLKMQNKTHPAFEKDSSMSVFNKNNVLHPEGVFVSQGHTWARPQNDGTIKIGVDDFILKALSNLKIINLPATERVINKGEVVFQAESNGNVFNFRSPVSGKIKLANAQLNQKMIQDPFENDWALEIVPSNFQQESKDLRSGNDLAKWLKEELSRLKEFLGHTTLKPELVGATMYDGGNIAEGAVNFVDTEGIKKFEEKFLKF